MTTTAMTKEGGGKPEEFLLHRVSFASAPIELYLLKARPLDDDTLLIQSLSGVYHVSRNGAILNQSRGDLVAFWDQESVVVYTFCYHESVSIFFLWNFRRGCEKSTPVKHDNFPVRCLETLQLSCHNGEKYVAAGLASECVRLLRVPSFEVVQTFAKPTALSVQSILQLLDGNSFICGYSCGTLIRWYTSDSKDDNNKNKNNNNNNNKAIVGGFKQQLFEGNDVEILELQQMRYDTRKLISCCGSGDVRDNVSIWDIETATRLCVLPEFKIRRTQSLFELGNSGLFMSLDSLRPKIWDFRGELLLLSVIDGVVFDKGVQLRNGNVLLLCQQKGVTYIEECQLIRKSLTSLCCLAIGKHWNQYDESMVNTLPPELYLQCNRSRENSDESVGKLLTINQLVDCISKKKLETAL